jgi:hypothetical protein
MEEMGTDPGGRVAAPRPIFGAPAEACPNRVGRQVAPELEEVRFPLDHHRLIAPKENVPFEAVSLIEFLGVAAV